MLQRIATLVGEAIGFSILGMLIMLNRNRADLNGLGNGSSVAMIRGISAILVATVFLVATCLHWRFCVRHPVALPVASVVSFAFAGPSQSWRSLRCRTENYRH
jgi:hypothetical protein